MQDQKKGPERNPRRCLKCPRRTVAGQLPLCEPCFVEKTIEDILDSISPTHPREQPCPDEEAKPEKVFKVSQKDCRQTS
jgi:hypothetical protein